MKMMARHDPAPAYENSERCIMSLRIQGKSAAGQRGVAVLAVVMFLSAVMLFATLGVMRLVESNQDQSMGLHSLTQAQGKAWQGVDLIYKYFDGLSREDYQSLRDDLDEIFSSEEEAEENDPVGALEIDLGEAGGENDLVAEIVGFESGGDDDNVRFLKVHITGTSAADTRAHANATVEAIYRLTLADGPSAGGGASSPLTSTIFRGDLSITGGTTSFNSAAGLADIAVDGNLTLGSASQAGVAGCATGNITMTGGGIKSNATLYAEGDFSVQSMSQPHQVTVWARNITIGNTGSANYTALKAGGYSANVYDAGGTLVGSAVVGGQLIVGTTPMEIPWTTGTVLPATDHQFVVTLTDSSRLLLDMSDAVVSFPTGLVTGYTYEVITGDGTLPESLRFEATGIAGGNLSIATLTVGQMWGHAVDISGWGGNYSEILANGNFNVVTGTIGRLTGGGGMHATSGGCSSASNCWSIPSLSNASHIAGNLRVGSYGGVVSLPRLSTQVANTSPGLPGVPFCDTRTDTVDSDTYKSQANYIFEYVDGSPQLTIKNVRLSNGSSIDGVYPLSTADVRELGGQGFLACGWYSNHCFRPGTPGSWTLNGVYAFPPGIAWFDGPVTVDGVSNNRNIVATIVSAGGVTLTQSGHGELIAPNFDVAALCQGHFRPTNLCTPEGQLMTWVDGETNTTYDGLPLGNTAIIAEGQLDIRGWTVRGHVVLGGGMVTGANQSVIYGRLLVGANTRSNTQIQQGGFRIVTDTLTGSQLQMPGPGESSCSEGDDACNGGDPDVFVQWTRYL